MKIQIEAKEITYGTAQRLVFTGPIWDEWDMQFCIHGEKLRWQCDYCEEVLAKKAKAGRTKAGAAR